MKHLSKRIQFIILCMICSCSVMYAGVTATLRGCVIDQKTGEALVGATIQVLQAGRTTITNNDGLFTI